MRIYLMRHGDALLAEQNPQRPLSEKGKIEVQKTAEFLRKNEIYVQRIYHSDKLRAIQTAEIIANTMGQHVRYEFLKGLQPDDTVTSVAICCNHWDEDVLLVGHLPFLPKLISELLLGNTSRELVEITTGGLVCLERKTYYDWIISYLIDPNLL